MNKLEEIPDRFVPEGPGVGAGRGLEGEGEVERLCELGEIDIVLKEAVLGSAVHIKSGEFFRGMGLEGKWEEFEKVGL